ncbi:MAG: flavodoxin family protein [Treponema sp.]|nr:flavodoxin family protein [Treponema sp.]
MKYLIISTLPKDNEQSNKVISSLLNIKKDVEVFYTDMYNIGSCIGCTSCWLKTPGICAKKDDWEILFRKFLKSDYIIFITEAKLGFVSYKMKNIIDRLIPLAIPYTEIYKGEARHTSRYEKSWNIGLIYFGNGDKDFLNEWMGRFTLNFFSKSLGVYSIDESEELLHGLDNI